MRHLVRRVSLLLTCVAAATAAASSVQAQDVAMGISDRAPRFYVNASPEPVPLDVTRTALLRRRISVDFNGTKLGDALETISRESGLRLMYSWTVIPVDRRVTLKAEGISVAGALSEILLDAGVDVLFERDGQAAIVKRGSGPPRAAVGAITGRVTDASTQQGIDGVRVFLEETRWSTTTSSTGSYRLSGVAAGAYTLVTRRLGYTGESRTVTVTDGVEANVDVSMRQLPSALQEVVVTATGEQRRLELGHVVGRINADSLVKEAPVSSLSELLTARVPGLQVFQSQGTVGGEVRLQIRGANSFLLSTEPIVIVDGLRYTTTGSGSRGEGIPAEFTSRLNDLNSNDIETIEVVKGPSAATLYGTDAANGVLVITTKRGKPGPARWSVYGRGTTAEIPKQQYPDIYWGWGDVPEWWPFSKNCTLSLLSAGICTQQDSVTVLPNPLNDPALTVFGSNPRWEYGANVAGGQQDFRYYFSGDFEDATGPVQMPPAIAEQLKEERGLSELPEEWRHPNTLSKLSLRANVSAVLGATADLRINTGYVHSATRSLAGGSRSPYSTGVFSRTPTDPYGNGFGQAAHPAESFAHTTTDRIDRFFGSVGGQWRPAAWLATRATVGLDLTGSNRYMLVRRGDAPNDFWSANGAVTDERARQLSTTGELGATATLRRGRLSTRTALGAQYARNLKDLLQSLGRDLPPGGTSVGEAASVISRQAYAETVTLGSYLEETLGLNERLFFTGALRVDGASAFGQDYDATVYPKLSASWLVSEEPLLPRLPGIDELRLRYAYGASGQQPASAMARPEFQPERTGENGVPTTVIRLIALGNPALRPERVREHEFGFDATALESRLQLGLTWYRRRTADQIVVAALPPGLGYLAMNNYYTNLGLTTQRGFEAEFTARVLDTRLLSWDLMVQQGVHRTKLVKLGSESAVEHRSLDGGYVEGYPLGARFQYPLVGYTDANEDGIVDAIQVGDTAVYAGESTPPRSQTLTAVIGLFERRLRLSALLERRSGFTQVNALSCVQATCRAAVDPSTPLAEQAQALYAAGFQAAEPGDFTRLREVTAAMDLPAGLARALRVRSTTLALSARNLALWTDFSGPDPESAAPSIFGSTAAGGTATGIPQGRSWTLRLDLGL